MVYLFDVEKELADWPERNQRRREWHTIAEAAELVDEPALSKIIKQLEVLPLDALSPLARSS